MSIFPFRRNIGMARAILLTAKKRFANESQNPSQIPGEIAFSNFRQLYHEEFIVLPFELRVIFGAEVFNSVEKECDRFGVTIGDALGNSRAYFLAIAKRHECRAPPNKNASLNERSVLAFLKDWITSRPDRPTRESTLLVPSSMAYTDVAEEAVSAHWLRRSLADGYAASAA